MIEYGQQTKTLERPFPWAAYGDKLQLDPEFPIRGIRIDNYTDQWIYVDSVFRYVPPLVTGWAAFVEPSSSNFEATYVVPPSGAAPRPRTGGTQALVKLFEAPIPDEEGVPFGLGVVTIPYAPVEAVPTRIIITTNPAPNTAQDDVMLAAPGVGFRYRLWGWSFTRSTAAVATYRIILLNTTSSTALTEGMMGDDPTTGFFPFGTHGVQMLENQGLTLRSFCSQANRSLQVVVHYSIESTT